MIRAASAREGQLSEGGEKVEATELRTVNVNIIGKWPNGVFAEAKIVWRRNARRKEGRKRAAAATSSS